MRAAQAPVLGCSSPRQSFTTNHEKKKHAFSSASLMAENRSLDDFFGDFKFVSTTTTNNNKRESDVDWGDFIDNSPQSTTTATATATATATNLHDFFQFQFSTSQNHPTFHSNQNLFDPLDQLQTPNIELEKKKLDSSLSLPPRSNNPTTGEGALPSLGPSKTWEKPREALPLSIFGDQEEEEGFQPDPIKQYVFPSNKSVNAAQLSFLGSGTGTGFNDLIVNLYGQNQIKVENGDKLEETRDFDQDDWEFKAADARSGFKEANKDLDLSEIKVEAMTLPTPTAITAAITGASQNENKVDEIMWGNSQGPAVTSGFSNHPQLGGDWFGTSYMFSNKSSIVENGFHLDSGPTSVNSNDLEWVRQPEQVASRNGKDSVLIDGNSDSDESFGDFIDGSVESGVVSSSSGQKEEVKIPHQSSLERKEVLFDDGIQENGNGSRHNQDALHMSKFSNGNLGSSNFLFSDDEFSYNRTPSLRNGVSNEFLPRNMSMNDLISNLYSQAEHTAVGSTQHTENGFSSAHAGLNTSVANDEDDFDEGSWEFKDASSGTSVEFPSSVGPEHVNSTESKLKNFADFYSMLKEESSFIILCHLDVLKNAENAAVVSGETARVATLHDEIQAVYKKLYLENVVSEAVYVKEHRPRTFCTNQMLEALKEPKFQALELEYQLSQRISKAEQDLSSANALFEHAISMLKILSSGSMEDQLNYSTMWSRMITGCAKELNHGASILKQSLETEILREIVYSPQGQRYVLSLGEIYRVVGVLRASAKLYRPWILSSLVDARDITTPLEDCMAAWSKSCLEEALRNIPDQIDLGYDGTAKGLLESIKAVHDLDTLSIEYHISLQEPICRLSLLSQKLLPDMKMVAWNGEQYFLTLANFWANRVSCDPPKLTLVHFGS